MVHLERSWASNAANCKEGRHWLCYKVVSAADYQVHEHWHMSVALVEPSCHKFTSLIIQVIITWMRKEDSCDRCTLVCTAVPCSEEMLACSATPVLITVCQ